MTKPPNIVLIQADQWRGDCLSLENHPVVHTPTLDSLALDGTRFTKAYSATPICIPARVSLMTGLSQTTHGRVRYQDGVPWDYPTTLAGEFSRQGYHTQAVGKLHAYPERSLLGFNNVVLHDGYGVPWRKRSKDQTTNDDYLLWLREQTGNPTLDDFSHGVHCNSHVARPWPLEERLHPTNWVASQGIDFLRRRDPRKPFMLYLSFHRPHPPYDPPGWAFEQCLAVDSPPPPMGNWTESWKDFEDPLRADTARGQLRPDLLRRAQAGYYGHINHIDQQINRFLYSLKEYDVDDNTWICFTSDHGEMLGDHQFFRKNLPFEGSARVPLIFRPPTGSKELPVGTSCDAVAEQRDVMPTLLEIAGLPIPDQVEGKSLLSCARGETKQVRESLHGEVESFGQSIQWLTDGRHKYIWRSSDGLDHLFDLEADPQELNDLARSQEVAANASELKLWRERLATALADRDEGYVIDNQLVAAPQSSEPEQAVDLPNQIDSNNNLTPSR